MKKNILFMLAIAGLASSIIYTGCKDDEDSEAPVITITGDAAKTVSLNGSYTDEGATAYDETDGEVTVTSDASSTNPDMNNAGVYTITYTATDAAGNVGTATRTVTVRNDAYDLAGSYGTTETPGGGVWTQTITVSSTVNNRITFSRFANYSNNTGITATVSTSGSDRFVNLNPTSQTANGIGTSGCNHTFASNGQGNKISLVSGKITFSVKFTDETLTSGGCTPTSALPYEDTFLQQ